MLPAQQNINVQKWVAFFSSLLLITKMLAYFLTGSVAILTDALESIVNVVAGFLGLYSLYLSAKPRDADHPYGHGKVEFLSAALEGSMIFIAGLLIIYEAVKNLITPSPIQQLDMGMILIGATAGINLAMGLWCIRTGRKNNSLALQASGKHLLSDTYSTLGILVGLFLIFVTDIQWLDSAVAILFSIIILFTGYKIVRSSLAGIMDERDMELLTRMVAMLNANRKENWIDLHNMRIIKYGSTLHLDCHLTVPWYLNVHEAHNEIDALASLVRKEFGESLELFVHSDGCLDFSCRICSKADCTVRKHAVEKRIEWTVENMVSNKKHEVNT
ncbi:MAG TPA: cation diffusion facilitator family transporter [Cyclobacteriaceae bacterium]|nr:cation diffusion facilitator family transporter [Cyclobacteriaceae bacterium]HRJ82145.1 cation diffusion facilitator family transporter [Cyclobacteriaceae bacterium]